jgi:hypothetical protein
VPKRVGGRGGAAGGYEPPRAPVGATGDDGDGGGDGGAAAADATLYRPDGALDAAPPDTPEAAAALIAATLREAGESKILAAVRAVGIPAAMALLRDTVAAERAGGVLTADGARRRTPGGVFFLRLKDVTTREQYKGIFAPDAAVHTARRNARKREDRMSGARSVSSGGGGAGGS